MKRKAQICSVLEKLRTTSPSSSNAAHGVPRQRLSFAIPGIGIA